MSKNLKIVIRPFCLILLLQISLIFSSSGQTAPSGQAALGQYSKGNYSAALEQFSALSAIYPRDPVYKYYWGVCLVRLEKDPAKATVLLKDARQTSSDVRKTPDDILFYLGRALQLTGDYSGAVSTFREFSDASGKKAAKDYQVAKFIQECNEKKGALSVAVRENSPARIDSARQVKAEAVNLKQTTAPVLKNDLSTGSQILPPAAYVSMLNEALKYQYASDSLTRLSLGYKEQLSSLPDDQKTIIKSRISQTDRLSQEYQKKADDLLMQAKKLSGQEEAQTVVPGKTIKKDSLTSEIKPKPVNEPVVAKTVKDTVSAKKPATFKDLIAKDKIENTVSDSLSRPETIKKSSSPEAAGVFSVFSINKATVAGDSKIQINPGTEPGLIYRIQLAVFRNQVLLSYFKGITPVYGFRNEGSDITNYYAGMFRRSADASLALVKVKSAGFKDAFIVALMDRKIVSLERAAQLEKEWGNKPFQVNALSEKESARDTVPPTLVFRVEAFRNKKPLPEDQVENLKRLAANRGFEIIKNAGGLSIYLIGKFLTFESAAEYADLLSRNGYKEAKVAAYLGAREIPVETARQLFENIK